MPTLQSFDPRREEPEDGESDQGEPAGPEHVELPEREGWTPNLPPAGDIARLEAEVAEASVSARKAWDELAASLANVMLAKQAAAGLLKRWLRQGTTDERLFADTCEWLLGHGRNSF